MLFALLHNFSSPFQSEFYLLFSLHLYFLFYFITISFYYLACFILVAFLTLSSLKPPTAKHERKALKYL